MYVRDGMICTDCVNKLRPFYAIDPDEKKAAAIVNAVGMAVIAASTAMIGCYIYYIGMDLIIFSLIRFTNSYCIVRNDRTIKVYSVPEWINIFLAVDVVQMLLNTIFGHAFSPQEIEAYGAPYFRMVPILDRHSTVSFVMAV